MKPPLHLSERGMNMEDMKRAVKKTLTIPKWLNDLAEEKNLPFSKILQDALMEMLGVHSYEEYCRMRQGDPLAEIVHVVRCRDCKHQRPVVDMVTHEVLGYWCCYHDIESVANYDYCSRAERRGDL